jgi:hypothetical protein
MNAAGAKKYARDEGERFITPMSDQSVDHEVAGYGVVDGITVAMVIASVALATLRAERWTEGDAARWWKTNMPTRN